MSAISASSARLRVLLAQDLLGALGKIWRAVEQSDKGEVPHWLVGQQRLRRRSLDLIRVLVPGTGAQQLLRDRTHLVRI